MGSAVKWVFCALFGTMSIVKNFHSFEYRKSLQTPGAKSIFFTNNVFPRPGEGMVGPTACSLEDETRNGARNANRILNGGDILVN